MAAAHAALPAGDTTRRGDPRLPAGTRLGGRHAAASSCARLRVVRSAAWRWRCFVHAMLDSTAGPCRITRGWPPRTPSAQCVPRLLSAQHPRRGRCRTRPEVTLARALAPLVRLTPRHAHRAGIIELVPALPAHRPDRAPQGIRRRAWARPPAPAHLGTVERYRQLQRPPARRVRVAQA